MAIGLLLLKQGPAVGCVRLIHEPALQMVATHVPAAPAWLAQRAAGTARSACPAGRGFPSPFCHSRNGRGLRRPSAYGLTIHVGWSRRCPYAPLLGTGCTASGTGSSAFASAALPRTSGPPTSRTIPARTAATRSSPPPSITMYSGVLGLP